MKIVKHLFNLFYPSTCICCEQNLLDQEKIICIECRADLPFVENGDFISNQLTLIFEGRVLIEKGASFLYYHPSGKVKKLIHELKYNGNENIGTFLVNLDWRTSHRKQTIYRSRFYCTCSITS